MEETAGKTVETVGGGSGPALVVAMVAMFAIWMLVMVLWHRWRHRKPAALPQLRAARTPSGPSANGRQPAAGADQEPQAPVREPPAPPVATAGRLPHTRGSPVRPCRWRRDRDRSRPRLVWWVCDVCGGETYTPNTAPPRECQRDAGEPGS